jgi:excisionase family DNA binding protein
VDQADKAGYTLCMAQTIDDLLLTIPEAAARLQMTPDGVYKLVQRGKLKAVRLSARKTRISRHALERYINATQAWVDRYLDDAPVTDLNALRATFVATAGVSPEEWLTRWKRDEIADTPENMRMLVQAIALHGAELGLSLDHPDVAPWASAALAPRP